MSVILVTDPTEPGYNSFVSLAEADEYFAGVYFGSSEPWDSLDPDDQARLLVTASRALSALSWTGQAAGTLAFPRTYPNQYVFDPVTPDFVKTLVLEWAKWLWKEGPNSSAASSGEGPVKSVKLGDLAIDFDTAGMASKSALPPVITALLQPLSPLYLTSAGRARSMSMRY